jgi:hypothetical protein
VVGVLACGLLVASCSPGPDDGTPSAPEAVAPTEPTTLLPEDRPVPLAVAVSELFYERAPVVVLAAEGDRAAQAAAASAAVAVGGPLLPVPDTDPADAEALTTELDRLEPSTLLAVGEVAEAWARESGSDATVVAAPGDPADLAASVGREMSPPAPVEGGDLTAAVAGLDRDRPAVLAAGSVAATQDPGELPAVTPAEPLDRVLVLADTAPEHAAAAATARAAGAAVHTLPVADPRYDADVVDTIAAGEPEQVVALGSAFGPLDRLEDRLATAATGVQLPGGGQLAFPGRRRVALYGNPTTPALGVLGEQGAEEAVQRARALAESYQPLVDEPVVPTFEIITTIASTEPGPSGNYSNLTAVEVLRPWVDLARDAGVYVVLDLQPGRSDFLTQAQLYEELLAEPHVGLALDPEWRLAPGQRHLAQIGSVGADEVNGVIDWLATVTRERNLPQKVLVLHQFRTAMITERERVDTGRDEVAVLIHADGFGTPELKLETWNVLRADRPEGAWWGWKNFIDEDTPTLTPEQTLAVYPDIRFVSYQ